MVCAVKKGQKEIEPDGVLQKDAEGPRPSDPCKDLKESNDNKNFIIGALIAVILAFIGFSYDSYSDRKEDALVDEMKKECKHGGFDRYRRSVSCHYGSYEISERGYFSLKLDQLNDRIVRLENNAEYSK